MIRDIQIFAGQDISSLRSTNRSEITAKNIHGTAKTMRFTGVLAYEGAFLYACAQFEDVIRKLIEWYLDRLQAKIPLYDDLPDVIKERHVQGSAQVITKISRDQFSHLTSKQLLQNLSTCLSGGSGYKLTPEAFSTNDNNFKAKVLEEHFQYLGIKNIITLAAQKRPMIDYFCISDSKSVETRARILLGELMNDRNRIIHRNPSFLSPGETRVKECAVFFCALIDSIERTLVAEIRRIT